MKRIRRLFYRFVFFWRTTDTTYRCSNCHFDTRSLRRARKHAKTCKPQTRAEKRRARRVLAKGGIAL